MAATLSCDIDHSQIAFFYLTDARYGIWNMATEKT